jgi:hypothetical protein
MPEGETGFDAAGIEARLRQPLVPREDGVFRLGLVLNGTAAAGAWTAGALDFLVEALDLWDDKKRDDRERGDGRASVPDHELRVGIAGGTSGGGLCASLLARAAMWDFPHATDAEAADNAANPFWRAWVETLDVASMFDASGPASRGSMPASLLSGTACERVGELIRAWPGDNGLPAALPPRRRGWLADPFRVLLALTNLRGVPYRIEFGRDGGGRERASHYLDHADHALFAFAAEGGSDADLSGLRGDEHLIRDAAGWERFAEFAVAAAAFPGGFPARRLSRPAADYEWRGVVLPGEGIGPSRIRLRRPAWDALDPPVRHDLPFVFDSVDGGAMDDRTVELVRTALCGLGGSNPRGAKEAHSTVLLLDPLAAVARCDPPPPEPCDLLRMFGGLAAAWADRGRFSAADLLLALEPGVSSRFLLAARREREGRLRHGAAALATAGMGGFMGFLHRELRIHDYLMGRENCRYFLMHEFVLHEDNPVFRGFASRHPAAAEEYRPRPGQPGWLPIVPVAEHLRVPRLLPDWPRRASLDPGGLAGPMEGRFAVLLRRLLDHHELDAPAGATEARIR